MSLRFIFRHIHKEILEHYNTLHFKISDGIYNDETIVTYITQIAQKHEYRGEVDEIENIGDIIIYPPEFFCPMNMNSGELNITSRTRTIHWYSASWKDAKEVQIHEKAVKIYKIFPNKFGKVLSTTYEYFWKLLYLTKKEGLNNVIKRIVRKMKKMRI